MEVELVEKVKLELELHCCCYWNYCWNCSCLGMEDKMGLGFHGVSLRFPFLIGNKRREKERVEEEKEWGRERKKQRV